MKFSLETFAVLAAVSTVVSASNAANDAQLRRRQHHSISRMTDSQLSRRAESSKWTWYDTEESGNPGACGTHIKNYENAVAWPLSEFNAKEHCFKKVTITFKGRSEVATVLDACEACPHEGLDLSKGLFEKMTSLGDGIIYGSWTWSEGGGEQPQQSTNPPQTTATPTTKEADPTTTATSTSTSTREEPTSDRASTTPSQEPAPTTTSSSTTAQPSNARARVEATTSSTPPASTTPPVATSSTTPPAAPAPTPASTSPVVKAAAPTTAASSTKDIVVGNTIRVCKRKAAAA